MLNRNILMQALQDLKEIEVDFQIKGETPPDLRHAIHHLQLWSSASVDSYPTRTLVDESSSFAIASDDMESLSYCDSYLERQESHMPEVGQLLSLIIFTDTKQVLACNNMPPSEDDELGYTILYPSRNSLTTNNNFGSHDRDRLIVSSAIHISRGGLEGPWTSIPWQSISRASMEYSQKLAFFANNRAIPGAHVVKQPAFVLDYLPAVRSMAAADDQEDATLGDGKRRTRTSFNARYIRTIQLSDEERQLMENWK